MGSGGRQEAMGSSLDSIEKALQAAGFHLLNKVAWTAAGMEGVWREGGWIFLTCLEGKYGLCYTMPPVQCAETLERTIATYVDKNPVAMKNSASLTVMVLNVMRLCVSTSQ